MIQPEIQVQYLFVEWLVIYEMKYVKFNVNLVKKLILSMCGSERKFSSVAAALDMLLPQKIVSFICNSQRTIGLCRPSSCVY